MPRTSIVRISAQFAGALILVVVATPTLHAQRSSRGTFADTAEWLDDCRNQERNRWSERDSERHCEVRSSMVRASGGRIVIDASHNGSIRILGGNGDSIRVFAKVVAGARSDARAREIASRVKVTLTPTSIAAEGPSMGNAEHWSVSFDVMMPRGSDVVAETRNGGVYLEGLRGRSEARAVNGPVTIRDMGGDVIGRTTNGPVNAQLQGTKWEGRGLDVATTNGPVTLTIPAGFNAELETGTVNGPMRFDFPVTVKGRITRRIMTTLGSGGPPIRAVTTNGPLTVRQQ